MKMRNMSKNALAVAVGAGLAAMPVLSAQAIDYSISGQVNRTIVLLDNGDDSDIFHADNDTSSSRVNFSASGDYGGGTVGAFISHQFESNSTEFLDLPNVSDNANADSLRNAELWFSYDWGKLTLGQGSNATDGATEQDLSGGGLSGVYAYPIDMMQGVTFVDSSGVRQGVVVSDVISSFDGGRVDRIRYDSPSLGALSFAGSLGNGSSFEAVVKGNHEFGQSQLAWAVGIGDDGDLGGTVVGGSGAIEADNIDPSDTVGSASLRLGNGLSFTVSFGERDLDVAGRDDPEQTYFKVGYQTDAGHAFGIGVGTYDDVAANGDEADVTQIGWDYSPNASVDLYASYTVAELDRLAGPSLEDVTGIQFGTRVKFK